MDNANVLSGLAVFMPYGNTAQFPPCGLSTAVSALRIMRYCLIFFYAKMDGQLS